MDIASEVGAMLTLSLRPNECGRIAAERVSMGDQLHVSVAGVVAGTFESFGTVGFASSRRCIA